MCPIKDLFSAMAGAFLKCQLSSGGDIAEAEKCLTDPEGEFKREWGECIDGHLLPDELEVSKAMTKAWTNFAIYG